MLIGVDDMDLFKGIELKLQALERLLDHHAEWRGRLVLVQVTNPPRRASTPVGSPAAVATCPAGCCKLPAALHGPRAAAFRRCIDRLATGAGTLGGYFCISSRRMHIVI